jgi:hypothetical protein
LRPLTDEQEQQKRIHSFLIAEVEAKKQIVAELSANQAEKSARAKRITKLTIQNLNDDIAYAAKSRPSEND